MGDFDGIVGMAKKYGHFVPTQSSSLEEKETEDWHEYTSNGERMRMNLKTKQIERVPTDKKEEISECDRLRSKGNELYKDKRFSDAIDVYSQAIRCVASHDSDRWMSKVPCYLNRAQCNLCLERWGDAISDCDLVLEKDPANIKALFRKSRAYFGRKQFKLAAEGFQQVISIEESNAPARQMLQKSTQMERKSQTAFKQFFHNDGEGRTDLDTADDPLFNVVYTHVFDVKKKKK
eukprot:165450_1